MSGSLVVTGGVGRGMSKQLNKQVIRVDTGLAFSRNLSAIK